MATREYRIERDSMGEVQVPKSAYYGAQTQRTLENFPISGVAFPAIFIRSLRIGHPSRGACHRLRCDDYAVRPNGEFRIECDNANCYSQIAGGN